MKNISLQRKARAAGELAMTPMIDVVFLLLIFFLATASFDMIERSMPTGISDQPPAIVQQGGSLDQFLQDPADQTDEVVIAIKPSEVGSPAQFFFNDVPLENAAAIAARVSSLVAVRADVPIIVAPDTSVPMGSAILAYDLAKGAGALEVFFAVE